MKRQKIVHKRRYAYSGVLFFEIQKKVMQDLNLKKNIINEGLDVTYRKLKRNLFKCYGEYRYCEDSSRKNLNLAYDLLDEFVKENGVDVVRVCNNLNHSYYRKRKIVKDRIKYMLENYVCLFLTFTFDDKHLESTSRVTRRQKVSRFLNEYNCLYVANIDFGRERGREHYHAVIATDHVNYDNWTMGIIDGKKCRLNESSEIRIATYITKLSNHAIKDSTKNERVIYSKLWGKVNES